MSAFRSCLLLAQKETRRGNSKQSNSALKSSKPDKIFTGLLLVLPTLGLTPQGREWEELGLGIGLGYCLYINGGKIYCSQ